MSNVFLTNTTGYIGSSVSNAFKAKGYKVSAIARSEKAVNELSNEESNQLKAI